MSIKVLNIDSTGKSENLDLSKKLIGLKVNNKLLKYVVDWQLNRSKKRVAKTAVILLKKFQLPLLPKTVWDAPAPKEAPASAPLPCCIKTNPIIKMAIIK